jgi:hypothetical protein
MKKNYNLQNKNFEPFSKNILITSLDFRNLIDNSSGTVSGTASLPIIPSIYFNTQSLPDPSGRNIINKYNEIKINLDKLEIIKNFIISILESSKINLKDKVQKKKFMLDEKNLIIDFDDDINKTFNDEDDFIKFKDEYINEKYNLIKNINKKLPYFYVLFQKTYFNKDKNFFIKLFKEYINIRKILLNEIKDNYGLLAFNMVFDLSNIFNYKKEVDNKKIKKTTKNNNSKNSYIIYGNNLKNNSGHESSIMDEVEGDVNEVITAAAAALTTSSALIAALTSSTAASSIALVKTAETSIKNTLNNINSLNKISDANALSASRKVINTKETNLLVQINVVVASSTAIALVATTNAATALAPGSLVLTTTSAAITADSAQKAAVAATDAAKEAAAAETAATTVATTVAAATGGKTKLLLKAMTLSAHAIICAIYSIMASAAATDVSITAAEAEEKYAIKISSKALKAVEKTNEYIESITNINPTLSPKIYNFNLLYIKIGNEELYNESHKKNINNIYNKLIKSKNKIFDGDSKNDLFNITKNLLELDFNTLKFIFYYVDPKLFNNFLINHFRIKEYISDKINNLESYYDEYLDWYNDKIVKAAKAAIPVGTVAISSLSEGIKDFNSFYNILGPLGI